MVTKQWMVNGVHVRRRPAAGRPAGLPDPERHGAATGESPGPASPRATRWRSTRPPPSRLPLCTLISSRVTLANGATVERRTAVQRRPWPPGSNTYRDHQHRHLHQPVCSWSRRSTAVLRCINDWTLTATRAAGGHRRTERQHGRGRRHVTPPVHLRAVRSRDTTSALRAAGRPERGADPELDGQLVLRPGRPGHGTVIPGFSDGLNGGVTVPLGLRSAAWPATRPRRSPLIKQVINDNGGTAVPGDWNLTATPTARRTVPPGLLPQTCPVRDRKTIFVRPGQTYALTESGRPPGYMLNRTSIAVTSVDPAPRRCR